MLSLSRRKAPLNWAAARHSFVDLPDDILIAICMQCRIDELLALRLVHSRIRNLISEYILSIALSVARSTFPHSDRLLRPLDDRTQHTLEWLKGLIPQQLAAILVDRHRVANEWSWTQDRYGIPAEDSYGNEIRARVANGWRVLRRLSIISREVHSMHAKDTSRHKLFLHSRNKLETLLQKEQVVLERRLEYMKNLPNELTGDYKLMLTLLSATFSTSLTNVGEEHEPWIFDFGNGINGKRAIRMGESWLTWFILAEGPEMFWKQWWILPPDSSRNYIRDLALSTFNNLPPTLADHQRSLAQEFQKFFKDIDFSSSNPFLYFEGYMQRRLHDERIGIPPAAETMTHVPIRINFRCPEELVKRSKELPSMTL